MPQHPVDVERVAAELEVEALRQHDLERVAGTDVLLGDLDGLAVALGAGASPNRTFWETGAERRWRDELGVARALEVVPQDLQALACAVIGGLEQAGVGALTLVLVEQHVVDEGDPLPPVVEGGELADDRYDGIRVAQVVGRRLSEAFDLPHDVITEIADEPAVKRRQLLERRRPEPLEERLDAAKDAFVTGHRRRQ